ncbi:MAG: STAS domain-containing protein [Ignavibacteriae bacterium]|nr:STAS domain-containing protein [Ignavibacteriota bacterium]
MSDFKVGIRQIEGVTVLDLKGYLDAHTAPDLEHAFQKSIDSSRFNLVVNFRDLAYISSAGLGVLMQFIEDVRKNSGDIKLTSMSPRVYNVFDLLGFPMLYEIYSEETEAIDRFRNNPADSPYQKHGTGE